jgi:hypothetical protein
LTFLAGVLLIATGLMLAMYGFMALISDVGRSTDVAFRIGPDAWGIIHLLGGILLFIAGCNIFVGKYWARLLAIGVACLAVLGGLISIDAYPIWSIGLIVLNVGIIWALVFHGTDVNFD